MDETYDAVVLGTGLTECIISGLLSVDGLKVRVHRGKNSWHASGLCCSHSLTPTLAVLFLLFDV